MALIEGYPFWLIKDDLPYNYPVLKKTLTKYVAVIGSDIGNYGAVLLFT